MKMFISQNETTAESKMPICTFISVHFQRWVHGLLLQIG